MKSLTVDSKDLEPGNKTKNGPFPLSVQGLEDSHVRNFSLLL